MHLSIRSLLVFLFDLTAVVIAWVGGFLIRFNFSWPSYYNDKVLLGLGILLVVHAAACRWAGLYRGMWIFASLPDLKRVLKAVAVSAFGLFALVALDRTTGPAIPRSMLVLYPLLLPRLGFGVATALVLFALARVIAPLPPARLAAFAVGSSILATALFRRLLAVPLPAGPWGF